MTRAEFSPEHVKSLRAAQTSFYEVADALRPELYRYCLSLTRSPWEAEDLCQEALARALARMGERHSGVERPKSYLFRIATNTWIDQVRRYRPQPMLEEPPADAAELNGTELREALTQLAALLPPSERVCVLLKDVFGFAHAEIGAFLGKSEGSVKVALHRGRKRLAAWRAEGATPPAPAESAWSHEALLDQVVEAFNARDVPRLLSLVHPQGETDIVGIYGGLGEGPVENVLEHTFIDTALLGAEKVLFRGEPVVVLWYEVERDGAKQRVVRDLIRLEGEQRCTRMRYYYFCPETLAEVCRELGLAVETQGYRY